ncbi:DUF982 domain-containing protein [Rhizobium sp. BK379]|jgi:hypothetical protein|uniref:DUF982 domain-containing protein n=1 Tax=Rhizobium sp. BK379 TaxID=2587059 RepID=UPI000379AA66|nr:DUF982 domain-containing protein [Rhizobium sp. BK379]MBB3447272.1 hypothetical protein [Rhizobium sp. BK379]
MAELELSPVRIKKISVQIDGQGYRDFHTVSGLSGLLMSEKWPKKAGNTMFQRALAQCFRALATHGGGARARKAFVDAARDARITVLPDDAPKARSAPAPRRKTQRSDRSSDLRHQR